MKILTIGTDASILERNSFARERQLLYFEQEQATIVVLNKGKAYYEKVGSIEFVSFGGKNKFTAFVKAFFGLLDLSKKERFELITTQDVLFSGMCGFLISKIRKIKLVAQIHGEYLYKKEWLNNSFFNPVLRIIGLLILRRSYAVRVVSQRILEEIHSRFGIDKAKLFSIPIGTDLSIFIPNTDMQRSRIKNILFVGRLVQEKEPMLFVEVTKEILNSFPDTHVFIAGDGVYKKEMQESYLKSGLDSRVTFLGTVPHDELAKQYQNAYLHLHTASSEGWGMIMIEAMASGCPTVTTDTGCAGEALIDKRNALVVPINDKQALVKSCEILLEDEQLRDAFARQGIIDAKDWSFESLSKKLVSFFKACVNEN
jgi:glycogen(starch) synthase